MSAKEVLPFLQKPVPFVKVLRKYFLFLFISLVLTLSLLAYVLVPSGLTTGSATAHRNLLSQSTSAQNLNAQPINDPTEPVEQQYLSHNETESEEHVIYGQPLDLPSGEDPNSTVRAQRQFVKQMMSHAWDSYAKYAWGHNELKPLTLTGHTSDIFGGDNRLGATIVDSLSTLYIMNMTTEFRRGRNWVARNLDLSSVNSEMSVFETNIRFVGGLLSAYALTRDQVFLDKAKHVADKILPAFETPTGMSLDKHCC